MKTPFLLGMQAVMAMRFGEAALARQQAWLAVCYRPGQLRSCQVLCLTACQVELETLWIIQSEN